MVKQEKLNKNLIDAIMAEEPNPNLVRNLLYKGADPNTQNEYGKTAVELAYIFREYANTYQKFAQMRKNDKIIEMLEPSSWKWYW